MIYFGELAREKFSKFYVNVAGKKEDNSQI